jgi:hypothetical protein
VTAKGTADQYQALLADQKRDQDVTENTTR